MRDTELSFVNNAIRDSRAGKVWLAANPTRDLWQIQVEAIEWLADSEPQIIRAVHSSGMILIMPTGESIKKAEVSADTDQAKDSPQ